MFENMQRFEARAFLGLVLVATALFFWLILPFFNVFLWAVVIAAVLSPVSRRLQQRWSVGPNLAALVTVLLALFLVILPMAWILYSGAREGLLLYQQFSENPQLLTEIVDKLRAAFPKIQDLLSQFGYDVSTISSDLSSLAMSMGGFLAKQSVAFGGGAADFLANLAMVMYVAFFFVRDGAALRAMLIRTLPFGDHREKRLMSKFAGVMRATVKGSLLVAMAQGTLGGLIFWILDIRAAVLWGVAMTILSLIPVVGSAIVWLPAAIYLLATGDYVHGVVLMLYGAFVIGLADNILRPIFVGRDTKMPDYLILISTLGGFSLFGMDGFITGPLLAAIFITVWQIFTEENAPEGSVPVADDSGEEDDTGQVPAVPRAVPETPARPARTPMLRRHGRIRRGQARHRLPLSRTQQQRAARAQAQVPVPEPAQAPERPLPETDVAAGKDSAGQQSFWQRLSPFSRNSR